MSCIILLYIISILYIDSNIQYVAEMKCYVSHEIFQTRNRFAYF